MTGPAVILCRSGKNLVMDEEAFVVGQLAGPGTYRCEACGAQFSEYALSFEIEPCPCGGMLYRRVD